MFFLKLLYWGYLVIWTGALIHWLRRKGFYPILGRGWSTRILWLVTFVFLNPLLTLAYLLFGVFLKPPAMPIPPGRRRWVSASALLYIGLVIVVFERPVFRSDKRPVTVSGPAATNAVESKADERNKASFNAQATEFRSQVQRSSTATKFNANSARFACGTLHIRNESEHPAVEKAGRLLQESLSRLPFVETVTYFPAGTAPETGGMLPDVTVMLDCPEFKEEFRLLGRHVRAQVRCAVARTPMQGNSHVSKGDDPPLIDFEMKTELELESEMRGVESASAKYGNEAKEIAKELGKEITQKLLDYAKEHGLAPRPPESLMPPYEAFADDLPFLKAHGVPSVVSGHGMMTKNLTIWRFRDDRPTTQVLAALSDSLAAAGWKGVSHDTEGDSPTMCRERGAETLMVFRERNERPFSARQTIVWTDPEAEAKPAPPRPGPLVARYEKRMSHDEITSAMTALLDSGPDTETLLMYAPLMWHGELKRRWEEAVLSRPAQNADAWLQLTQIWKDRKRAEQARDALMKARVMAQVEEDYNYRHNDIERMAKELGIKDVSKAPLDAEAFQECGFADLDETSGPVHGVIALGEALPCFLRGKGGEITVCAVKITQDYFLREGEQPEALTPSVTAVFIDRESHGGSTSRHGGQVRNGVWQAEGSFDLGLGEDRRRIAASIRGLEDGRFEVTLTPVD